MPILSIKKIWLNLCDFHSYSQCRSTKNIYLKFHYGQQKLFWYTISIPNWIMSMRSKAAELTHLHTAQYSSLLLISNWKLHVQLSIFQESGAEYQTVCKYKFCINLYLKMLYSFFPVKVLNNISFLFLWLSKQSCFKM